MANLGDLILNYFVNTDPAEKSMKKAEKKTEAFSEKLSGFQGKLAMVAGAVGIGLLVNALKDLALAQMGAINDTGDLAMQLGTTTSALMQLQYAAEMSGSSGESMNASLKKMNDALASATTHSGAAADALATLGLPVEELIVSDPAEAFMDIATALSAIENPAQQAALAADIFGQANGDLLNTINEGPEALQAYMADALKFGNAISDIDATKVANAQGALDAAGLAMQGIGNILIVEVAPYIEAAANAFISFAHDGVNVSKLVSTSISWIIEAISFVADVLYLMSAPWNMFAGLVQDVVAVVVGTIGGVVRAFDYVLEAVGLSSTGLGSALLDIAETYQKSAHKNFDMALNVLEKPLPGDQFRTFAKGIVSNAEMASKAVENLDGKNRAQIDTIKDLAGEVTKLNESLKQQVANFGLSSAEAAINKLAMDGASESQLAEARALSAQLTELQQVKEINAEMLKMQESIDNFGLSSSAQTLAKLEKAGATEEELTDARYLVAEYEKLEKLKTDSAKLDDRAKSVKDSVKTDAQKYKEQQDELNELLKAGKIDQNTFDLASAKIKKDKSADKKDKSESDKEFKNASALEYGSSEARSQLLAHRFSGINDPATKLNDLNEKQLDEQKKIKELIAAQGQPVITYANFN